jgi:hypothetical protein
MDYLIALPIVFIYTAIIWIAVLFLYNMFVEPFDFGPLGRFAGKSALLVLLVALTVTFVPFGSLASLLVWWIGLMIIFKKDFWECKVLVILIWGMSFLLDLAIKAVLMSLAAQSPVSTV